MRKFEPVVKHAVKTGLRQYYWIKRGYFNDGKATFRYHRIMHSAPIRRLPLACAALAALVFAACPVAKAAESAGPKHGIAMHGEPALPANFERLPYADPAAVKGGRLRIGFQGAFDSLNPFNVKSGSTAQGLNVNVFQTLMARNFDEPFSLYGLIAQTIETDDARSYVTFRLDPRARFSDGSAITAGDVRFTFELLKEKGRPQSRAVFALVKSIDTPDERTIRFDLAGADDRELPLILALMPVLSQKHVDPAKFIDASFAIPVASGPYIIASVDAGQGMVLKRNQDYWAKDLPISRGFYNFDEIKIEYYRDATALYETFKASHLDYREESNPLRWRNGYDFPAVREGRVKVESAALGIPKGMQGFAFNTRREIFGDARLREAFGMLFDFEWMNANLFGGLYRRTTSFFDESELASTGRAASDAERALLARFPDAVREDILEGRWTPPVSDGTGRDRAMVKRALALLRQAGFAIRDGKLRRASTGAPVTFEIMAGDRAQERLAAHFASGLARIGVDVRVRMVDEVQFQRRRQKFDFDMMIGYWAASASPGNEQRSRWGAASAEQEASFNLAGARAPAIDALIGEILGARTREAFVTAVRAYDRVLLSGFYIVPLYHNSEQWFAWSTKLGKPARGGRYASPPYGATLETWWRKSP